MIELPNVKDLMYLIEIFDRKKLAIYSQKYQDAAKLRDIERDFLKRFGMSFSSTRQDIVILIRELKLNDVIG